MKKKNRREIGRGDRKEKKGREKRKKGKIEGVVY